MSNEFDSLFDGPADAAAPADAPTVPVLTDSPATSLTTAVSTQVVLPSEKEPPSLLLALFKPGADVQFQGESHKVSYVHISRKGLFVRLKEKDNVVPADKVKVALTRVFLPLNANHEPRALQLPPLPTGTDPAP